MATLTPETPVVAAGLLRDTQRHGIATFPTLEIVGGNVNLYMSNNDLDTPPDFANMTPITNGQNVTNDIEVSGQFNWIAYEVASGTPVVKECGVID